MRMSAPSALISNRFPFGDAHHVPKAGKDDLGRSAIAIPSSTRPMGSTHRAGPWPPLHLIR